MMADGAWSVANAKARFSELIETAIAEGPQRVTRHGKDAVVVVSEREWARLTRPARSVVDVLLDPGIRGVLEPGEALIFARDPADGRPSPSF
jgi:prevent-host-death family protein